jgi:hypothetical protein
MQQNHSISAKRHIHYRLYQLPPFFDSLRNYTNLWPCPVVCLFLGASQPASLRNGWRHLYSHQHLPDGKPNWTPFEKVKLQMIRVSAHCYNYIYVYIYTIFIYIYVCVRSHFGSSHFGSSYRLKAGLPHDRSPACVPKRILRCESAGLLWALLYHFYQEVSEGTGEVAFSSSSTAR